ncbi:osteopetrosis-associated transmembrane protein 1 isoform X2 [Narcine bancroftii]|uniref:osteopetrosis-associated transmembrane protein 1 isoform X2 n=1 Tax=Narcine bancroftii TaxID=1343680 RepID=UPI0038316AD2
MVPAVLSCALLGLLCEEALAFSSSIGLMPELNRNSNLRDNAASAQSRSSVWWGDVPGPLRVREARSRADWDSAGGWWGASLADGLEGRAVSQTCRQLLLEFGDRGAALVGCALKNARPVQVCERCLSDFHSFWDAFANLSKNSGNDSCSTQLLTSDSLQIVLKIRNFLQLIWIKSQCDACLNENKTAPSMDTLNFKKLLNDSLNCFEQHSRHPVYKNYSDLCIKCKASYNNLTEHYSRMEKNENLCIDIIDALSSTSAASFILSRRN